MVEMGSRRFWMKMGLRVARYSRLSSGQLRTKLPAATQAASLSNGHLFHYCICKIKSCIFLKAVDFRVNKSSFCSTIAKKKDKERQIKLTTQKLSKKLFCTTQFYSTNTDTGPDIKMNGWIKRNPSLSTLHQYSMYLHPVLYQKASVRYWFIYASTVLTPPQPSERFKILSLPYRNVRSFVSVLQYH